MSPEQVVGELRAALETALLIGAPLLLSVLVVGTVVGIVQAATQINEQTISFVARAAVLAAVLALSGHWLLGILVDFTRELILRIPLLVG